jgi:C-terminal processing protease CtpA/Prc
LAGIWLDNSLIAFSKGYVLDLRNASHGPLYVAVSIADALLEEGEIVSVKGGSPEKIDHCNDRPGDIINGKPLVVLISGGTASGAEIVAGAPDHKRATVMGMRSFGRGSEQTIIPFGGRSSALRARDRTLLHACRPVVRWPRNRPGRRGAARRSGESR